VSSVTVLLQQENRNSQQQQDKIIIQLKKRYHQIKQFGGRFTTKQQAITLLTIFVVFVILIVTLSSNGPVQSMLEDRRNREILLRKEELTGNEMNRLMIYYKHNPEVEKYLKIHPDTESLIIGYNQYIFPINRQVKSSRKMLNLRYRLLECFAQTPTSMLPKYESEQHNIIGQCGTNHTGEGTYHPFRRGQNFAKILYCLAKQPEINNAVDVFISVGGAALMVAQGFKDGAQESGSTVLKKVYGFEIDPDVCDLVNNRLSDYPHEIICKKIMEPYQYEPSRKQIKSGGSGGALLDFCNQVGRLDMAIFDPPWEGWTYFKDSTGKNIRAQEFYVMIEMCKPKFVTLFNMRSHSYTGHPHNVGYT
jgi:hypothetical protein